MRMKNHMLRALLALVVLCSSASALVVDSELVLNARTSIQDLEDDFLLVRDGGHVIANDRFDMDGDDYPQGTIFMNGGLFESKVDFKLPDGANGRPCAIEMNAGTFIANQLQTFGFERNATIQIGGGTLIVESNYDPAGGNWQWNPAEWINMGFMYAKPGYELVVEDLGGGAVKIYGVPSGDRILIEDFERYGNLADPTLEEGLRVFYVWRDGLEITNPVSMPGNGTGSAVGHDIWDPASPHYEGHIIETIIAAGGAKSMPLYWDNTTLFISKATRTWSTPQDFTREGSKALSLWYQGRMPAGSTEVAGDQIIVKGGGEYIWETSDEFHFAYKEVAGPDVDLFVKVESMDNTEDWAKAAVMIRSTLDPSSSHLICTLFPQNGIGFEGRLVTGTDAGDVDWVEGFSAPYWVRIKREGGIVSAAHSPDGVSWTWFTSTGNLQIDGSPFYVGLAVSSQNLSQLCTAVFSGLTIDGVPTADLTGVDIGDFSNQPEPLYVTLEDSAGATAKVVHPDPAAVQAMDWAEWNIALTEFTDATPGFDPTNVSAMTVGVGEPDVVGDTGLVYLDQFALYPSRFVPGKNEWPASDISGPPTPPTQTGQPDGKVDMLDAVVFMEDWLKSDNESSNLIAHYKLDMNFLDSSGNGFHAVAMGRDPAPTFSEDDPNYGQAAIFDRHGEYLEAVEVGPLLNGSSELSVMCWVYADFDTDGPGNAGFVNFEVPDNSDHMGMRYDSTGSGGGGTDVLKFAITATDGEHALETESNTQAFRDWLHVAMVWSSGSPMSVYLDGVLQTPSDIDPTRSGTLTGMTTLIIGKGCKDNRSGRSWLGMIDDVRIYAQALSADDIALAMKGQDFLPEVGSTYLPLDSVANVVPKVGDEGVYNPANPDIIDLLDFAILADEWGAAPVWP
ncbi:MAG: LamG domain-containing protein [Phycisphaerales bacterium]|nr:MAG: LamG domain-containing protein [Phycisphaerales bacterium]